jgi:hypothetical protein
MRVETRVLAQLKEIVARDWMLRVERRVCVQPKQCSDTFSPLCTMNVILKLLLS